MFVKHAFLFILCLAAQGSALADLVARQGKDEVRLSTTAACKSNHPIVSTLPDFLQKQFREASATLDGKHFPACWIGRPEGAMIIYHDGDVGMIPVEMFQNVPGV